jgi:hypothetical protein
MENSDTFNQYRSKVEPALLSKLEEFQLLGYDSVSEDGLWDFLLRKKWKKVKDAKKLYEIVDDILSVKVSDFISYTTIETYKNNDFDVNDENEWKELLK